MRKWCKNRTITGINPSCWWHPKGTAHYFLSCVSMEIVWFLSFVMTSLLFSGSGSFHDLLFTTMKLLIWIPICVWTPRVFFLVKWKVLLPNPPPQPSTSLSLEPEWNMSVGPWALWPWCPTVHGLCLWGSECSYPCVVSVFQTLFIASKGGGGGAPSSHGREWAEEKMWPFYYADRRGHLGDDRNLEQDRWFHRKRDKRKEKMRKQGKLEAGRQGKKWDFAEKDV